MGMAADAKPFGSWCRLPAASNTIWCRGCRELPLRAVTKASTPWRLLRPPQFQPAAHLTFLWFLWHVRTSDRLLHLRLSAAVFQPQKEKKRLVLKMWCWHNALYVEELPSVTCTCLQGLNEMSLPAWFKQTLCHEKKQRCLSIRQFHFVLGASQESLNIHNAYSYSLLRSMCIIEIEAVNWWEYPSHCGRGVV